MELYGTYTITDGGEPAGELEVAPWGGYIRFRAVCRTARRAVFRLTAASGETRVSLGVMTPSGSGWTLDKRYSPAELRRLGLARIDACFLSAAAPEVWQPERDAARLFQDASLRRVCAGLEGALSRRADEAVLLAVPLDPKRPFPAMPIFCFGEAYQIDGNNYVVFKIQDGMLAV